MKQFLRYQVSGTTFLLWLGLFAIGAQSESFIDVWETLVKEIDQANVFMGLAVAMPIGVLIHQISVSIKNCILSKIPRMHGLRDDPGRELGCQCDYKKHLREKISNLNSFYYVRVDNALLSPLFAFFTAFFFYGCDSFSHAVFLYVVIFSLFLNFFILLYCAVIIKEINFYSGRVNRKCLHLHIAGNNCAP